ncbi:MULTISPECIES: bifunctional metallophosphatase/5'-nucleotidase [Enterococcus]|uniref:Multifunctional 2',3'-cyclic-nucleotide 2'-phosphodiesterase/5'-nucleotidase/3'-nucleotidase n=1 Tax=Enterococcus faecalis TaxID=1351 RepID=A0AC59HSF8_ENTFL|nr:MULTISPECIES: bifunctional metallophosphatase/5'-nucleotidase [Enterococcus]EGO2681318.1 bifunctional metallophosphatase/5'-nucleotidase [Enterococcus faecalis]EHB5048551.1 bifunctional metallophosphatase/5'-nucleotidase [Enterococcus faecalis]EKJ0746439.1 5'-nucleotidase C-terminal domain-containing protein [Enterococcus faecalis]EME5444800.1 5'-nucleotidase C-terminal domain-containing protein [Enterococcus faecalis]KAJ63679.1 5'-nucleotidase family protein in cluster with NagD-like phosp
MEEIVLFHTNDLHSHFENWPKIRRLVKAKRSLYQKEGKTVVTIDLGDFSDRCHPLTEATDGRANVAIMNTLAYDLVTIGNNEGIGNSKKQLEHLYDQATFEVVLANLEDPKTQTLPDFCQAYKIMTTKEGTKLGFIGLTAPFPLTYNPNGWTIKQVETVLPQLITEVAPQCDVLILLSHLGIDTDFMIAANYPEIQVILGSHTHHLFKDGEKINHVQLAAAGKYGQYIGEVHLFVDADTKQVTSYAKTIETASLEEQATDAKEIAGYLTEGHRLLQAQQIAQIPETLSTDLRQPHAFITVALKALKEAGQTEAAVLNNGLFLADLPEGIINADQLHEALPHPMHLIKVTLKGSDMSRLIREMEKSRQFLRKFPIRGMGFRGKIFGELCYDGIRFERNSQTVFWQGKPIQSEQKYTLTTVDHFQFVPFFPTIELVGEVEFLFPDVLRTVVANYLHAHYPIK